MKRNFILGACFLLLMSVSGYVTFHTARAVTAKAARSYSGYLVCQSCAGASRGEAADGTRVPEHPELHTVACLRKPFCIASGYGIFIRGRDGKYVYYKLDQKGSALAYQNIVSKTVRADHLRVEVIGSLQNRIIVTENVIEK
ncbi:hypothetical protein EDC14_104222 [Hydrogenispora ethanolica]|uniref:Uncharacterized protein n=1 Tax=Hydrogenispora ethanolica TaxID=1082276 RepID=A0A4R1QZC3_HYDET|nr:hypothetical protein [Hydrogenispora ethanolica]TCL58329.1 hypothetical protein EDC14_104222 [Hydrogenispora ethanolica]